MENDDMLIGSLYTSFYNLLRNFAETIVKDKKVAEDIVSGVFLKLWEHRNQIDFKSIEGYLWCSVRNNSLKYLELAHVKFKVAGDLHDLIELYHPPDPDNPLSILESEETKHAIENAIARLPPKCSEVFRLVKLKGFSYIEVAQKMGISVKTVYKHIAIAMDNLKEMFEKQRA